MMKSGKKSIHCFHKTGFEGKLLIFTMNYLLFLCFFLKHLVISYFFLKFALTIES